MMDRRFELITPSAFSRRIELGGQLGAGGAGVVHEVLGDPSIVVKIYHNSLSTMALATLKKKLDAMLRDPPDLPPIKWRGHSYVQIAWPEAILTCDGKFAGFGMPALEMTRTAELEFLLNDKLAKLHGLPSNMGARVTVARQLAAVVAALHQRGHHVVDMKPVNVSYYPDELYIAMLDCDGFSILDSSTGGRYPASMFTPEYLAPEFHLPGADPNSDPEAQDRFALAVNIFQVLCHGTHPYSGVLRRKDENLEVAEWIARGYFPYGRSGHPECKPNPYSTHYCLPAEILERFERAFGRSANMRPSAHEWATLLEKYATRESGNLISCKANAEHQHFAGLPCSHCAREASTQAARKKAANRPASTRLIASSTSAGRPPPVVGGAAPVVPAATNRSPGLSVPSGTSYAQSSLAIARAVGMGQIASPAPLSYSRAGAALRFAMVFAVLIFVIGLAVTQVSKKSDQTRDASSTSTGETSNVPLPNRPTLDAKWLGTWASADGRRVLVIHSRGINAIEKYESDGNGEKDNKYALKFFESGFGQESERVSFTGKSTNVNELQSDFETSVRKARGGEPDFRMDLTKVDQVRNDFRLFKPGWYQELEGYLGGDCHWWKWYNDGEYILEVMHCKYGHDVKLLSRRPGMPSVHQATVPPPVTQLSPQLPTTTEPSELLTNVNIEVPGGLYADAKWLFGPTDWNQNRVLPRGIPSKVSDGCESGTRSPKTAAERAISQAGWRLTKYPGTWQADDIVVIAGSQGNDINCGTTGVLFFVFQGDYYLGTLIPTQTESFTVALDQLERFSGGLKALFKYRSQDDPLCCHGYSLTTQYELRDGRLKLARAVGFVKN